MNHLVSFAAALISVVSANKFAEGSATREAMRIKGPMSAAFTPFDKHGELDFTNLRKMAARLSDWGVHRVMVAGTTGESVSLTREEKMLCTKEWLKIAPEYNLDIYVNVQSDSLRESKNMASEIAKLPGIKGFFSMSPSYFKPTSLEGLADSMAYVAAGAPDLPFWYYHFPEKNNVEFPMSDWFKHVDETGKIPNLMGMKFTDEHIMEVNEGGTFNNGKYNMLLGRDEMVTSALILGVGQGSVGSLYNFSSYNIDIVNAWNKHEFAKAKALQLKTIEVVKAWGPICGKNNCQKSILKLTGIDFGPLRLPQENLSHDQEMALGTALAAVGLNITAEWQYHPTESLYTLPQ